MTKLISVKRREAELPLVEVTTNDEGDEVYKFIGATTLPTRVPEELPDGTKIEGEYLTKNALRDIADNINNTSEFGGKHGSYRTISLFHNRVYEKDPTLEEAGYVKPDAQIVPLKDYPGEYGVEFSVETNKMYKPPENYPDYTPEKIDYKIKKNALGLSLEFNNAKNQEKIIKTGSALYREVSGINDFRGFGFARPDLIADPRAVRVREICSDIKKTKGETTMADEKDMVKLQKELAEKEVKLREATDALVKIREEEDANKDDKKKEEEAKVRESMVSLKKEMNELKLKTDDTAAKIRESIQTAFEGIEFNKPAKNDGQDKSSVKVREAYSNIKSMDFAKFRVAAEEQIEEDGAKLREMLSRTGEGFDFEKHQTLKVKCHGSQMLVVPTAKTRNVLDSSDMATSYNQTNAMFADKYVTGITETFLMEDTFMKVLPKEQHMGGNDKFQWRIWTQYTTVTGDNTLAKDPNVTSVTRTQRDFKKLETRIVEYQDGVEVTDFTEFHSMAAIGSLMEIELNRAAEAVTESMNADLFKPKTDATSGWKGFIGLIGVADSSTYGTIYGETRTEANRLLDSTLTNTYVSSAVTISVEIVRESYEKVLTHGSNLANILIVAHPTQVRKLFNSEDAAIRNNILTMAGAPPSFGLNRAVVPHIDGIPMIRDYRCESSANAKDMFGVVDISSSKGFNLVVSKPLGARGLAKVGTSESAYVNFWGCAAYKSPRNVFVHTSLTT